MINKLSTKSIFALLSILITIIIYFIIIIDSSINFPVNDDYPSILHFLIKYDDAKSIFEKIHLIYNQHNEHRIIFGKIITLSYYNIF